MIGVVDKTRRNGLKKAMFAAQKITGSPAEERLGTNAGPDVRFSKYPARCYPAVPIKCIHHIISTPFFAL